MKKKHGSGVWTYNTLKKTFRIMRLVLFLLLINIFQTIASAGYSQNAKITLKSEALSLVDVLRVIEDQSEYRFIYDKSQIDLDKKVKVNFDGATVKNVLEELFVNQGINYRVIDNQIILTNSASSVLQQSQTISGRVTDSSGSPLPGVTVVVKGTTQGTITGTDGNYSFSNIPSDAILVFSFVGMKTQEIMVSGRTTINVVMQEETIGIEEVVAVGFGTQKKVNLTGAVGTVSSEALQNRPVQNVQIALQGLVPGLNIQQTSGFLNAAPSMNIRGTGNLGTGSSAAPLVLIDGVEGNIRTINPQDIESISVLKDAAASSIYGSRAPFGVILITTKKGNAKQIQVNYNNNFRWGAPTVLPQVMDSYTQATYINDMCMNDNVTPHFTQERLQRIKDYQEGKITTVNVPDPANPTRWSSGYAGGNADNDIYDIYYKDWAFTQDHNISASGGNDRFTFYMGLGYQDANGLLEIADDSFRRFTPTGTIEAQMTDWMKLRYTTRFTRFDYSRPTGLTDNLYSNLGRQGWSCLPFRDDNGIVNNTGQAMVLMYGGRYNDQTDFYNNLGSLVLEPMKNWITTVEFNYNIKTWDAHDVLLPTYMYDVYGNPYVYRQDSYVSNSHYKENFLNLNVYSTYKFSLDTHNFTILAGAQMEDLKRTFFSLKRAGVIVPDLPVVDLTSGLNYNGTAATPSVSGNMNEWSTGGYFGRLNYDYSGKYLLEANLRYDGTSRFRKETRWNWFPSFSIGWNIARENFWENLRNTVSVLKLRGSYGKLGNQNTDSWYPTYQVMSVSSNSGYWLQNGAKPNTAYSPALISSSLTWEKINTWNIGIDINALDNRLTGSFDYYVRKTLDMVGPAMELPNILGKAVPRSNNTDLKTYGFELEIGWQDRLDNGLSYGMRLLLSDYQTEVTHYPNATQSLSTYIAGQKMGNIWGYETIGIAKSNEEMQAHLASLPEGGQNALGSNWAAGDIMYRDLNNDGKINSGANTLNDHGDLKIIGNKTPRYAFGLDMNSEWKGFDLRIFFQGVAKRDFWTSSDMFFGLGDGGFWNQIDLIQHVDYFRLEPSNDLPANIDAYYPRPLYNNFGKNQKPQTRYLQNAAYIRLKNVSLGYTIPQQLTKKISVNKLRVFFSGENLWTGTKLAPMFDPEAIDGMNTTYGDGYPLQKIMSFGLNITL
jgi:TonB-linked SusC/RagA family outer membrane protein